MAPLRQFIQIDNHNASESVKLVDEHLGERSVRFAFDKTRIQVPRWEKAQVDSLCEWRKDKGRRQF